MLIELCLAALSLAPHPDSLSSTLIRVQGRTALLTTRLQIRSVSEVVELDLDGDGAVSSAELEARRDAVVDYVVRHYPLRTGTGRDFESTQPGSDADEGVRLTPEPIFVGRSGPGIRDGIPYVEGGIEVELRYTHAEPLRDLALEPGLFRETSAGHIDLVTIEWLDHLDGSGQPISDYFALSVDKPRGRSDPAGSGAFGVFLRLGFQHILGGWDHLAFVSVLVLASRRLRSLLGVVTAFTVAHSITLALATLGVVDTSGYSRLIEAAVALSIAYVAADVLLHAKVQRSRWPEAFVFGLLHGLAFAGFLGDSLVRERSKGVALFSFNLGVEAGQVLVVLALAAVLAALPNRAPREERALAPAWLQRSAAGAVAALGLMWFFQRL